MFRFMANHLSLEEKKIMFQIYNKILKVKLFFVIVTGQGGEMGKGQRVGMGRKETGRECMALFKLSGWNKIPPF